MVSLADSFYNINKDESYYTKAAECYRSAAEKGDLYAEYSLGYMYSEGEGVPKDVNEAIRWLQIAADQGGTGSDIAGALLDELRN